MISIVEFSIDCCVGFQMRHGYPPHPLFKSTLDREAAMRAWESEDMRLPSRKL
jgi:hypothetical protein